MLHMTLLEKSGIHYPPSAPTFWLRKCAGSLQISSKLRRGSAVAAGQPGCVRGPWCPQAWPCCTIPTSQAGKGEPGQEWATSCPSYLAAWQHRSDFGGASLQPSPGRSGLEEAESDISFLGHFLRESQLKLGYLSLPFHFRIGDLPEVLCSGSAQSCWRGSASALGLSWVSGQPGGDPGRFLAGTCTQGHKGQWKEHRGPCSVSGAGLKVGRQSCLTSVLSL